MDLKGFGFGPVKLWLMFFILLFGNTFEYFINQISKGIKKSKK